MMVGKPVQEQTGAQVLDGSMSTDFPALFTKSSVSIEFEGVLARIA